MTRVTEHKTTGVTLGITDKDLRLVPELQSVTFEDVHGGLHTVYAHNDGPFSSVDSILAAYHEGTLHTHESDDDAIAHFRLHGDEDTADRIANAERNARASRHSEESGY